ncbi:MAG: type II toxin-antitoxin system HicA family toxin [Candidatus Edwardsbacteria bacterium]|nr:type II toxin-antitoxin system HicA family toxin [Candidatus Edwardsbacteria bacterium]
MSGLPILKPQQAIRAFERAGWEINRRAGSHMIMEKDGRDAILSVPFHKGKNTKRGLMRKLIRDAGLTVEEFLKHI